MWSLQGRNLGLWIELTSDLELGLVVTVVLFVSRNWSSAHLLCYTLLLYFPTFHLQISFMVVVKGRCGAGLLKKEKRCCAKPRPLLLKSEELYVHVQWWITVQPVIWSQMPEFKSCLLLSDHMTWATNLTFLYCRVLLESGDYNSIYLIRPLEESRG